MSVYINGVKVGEVEAVGVTDILTAVLPVVSVALAMFLVIALIKTLKRRI